MNAPILNALTTRSLPLLLSFLAVIALTACTGGETHWQDNDTSGDFINMDMASDSGSDTGNDAVADVIADFPSDQAADTQDAGDAPSDSPGDMDMAVMPIERCAPPLVVPGVEGPMDIVDLTPPVLDGRIIMVNDNDDLQAALDAAVPGDIVEIHAVELTGNFTLPAFSGNGWILLRSGSNNLPGEGERLSAEDVAAGGIARLVSDNGQPVLQTAPGAHHWRIQGLEFGTLGDVGTLVTIGSGTESDPMLQPHHIVLEQNIFRGDIMETQQALELHGAHLAVVDSRFETWIGTMQRPHAIATWNGPGPYLIANNFLQSTGDTLSIGADVSAGETNTPADIWICRNHFDREPWWDPSDMNFDGTDSLGFLEVLNAHRVNVDGNVFDGAWSESAVAVGSQNTDGMSPWVSTHDVVFSHNVFNAEVSFSVMGVKGPDAVTAHTTKVAIVNNLLGDTALMFSVTRGVGDLTITHNTGFTVDAVLYAGGEMSQTIEINDNIFGHGPEGIYGEGTMVGTNTLETHFAAYNLENNVLIGGPQASYPMMGNNSFPAMISDVGFVSHPEDLHLRMDSMYTGTATGGVDPGADIDAVGMHTGGVVEQ